MRTELKHWPVVLACLVGFHHCVAQGTAFTYQGQLNDNGRPANGLYDIRFTLWDSLTNGNLVAGSVTNSGTAASNGLFVAVLDFGSDAFTGPARWLQLDVRTNGNGEFVSLVPRQPILPTPYSIMANSASNLLGALPASQLSGVAASLTVSNLEVIGTITGDSNSAGIAFGSAVSAPSFIGAFGSSTLDETNLDDWTWTRSKAGSFSDDQCIGRFSWTKLIAKLQSPQNGPTKIAFWGTGLFELITPPVVNFIVTNMNYPLAGSSGAYLTGINDTWDYAYTPAGTSLHDQYWWINYLLITNNGDHIDPMPSYKWDIIEVDYVTSPDAAKFNLCTNGATTNAVVTGINPVKAGIGAASVFWTNPAGPQQLRFCIKQTAAGTNRIVNMWAWNSKVTNGFILDQQNHPGTYSQNWLNITNAIRDTLLKTWQPDLIVWESLEYTNTILTNWSRMVTSWQTNCPGVGVVLCADYPCIDAGFPLISLTSQERGAILAVAEGQSSPVAMFDGFTPFVSTNYMLARGWDLGNTPHIAAAYVPYGYLLYRWLDFDDYYHHNLPAPISPSSFGAVNSPKNGYALRYTNGNFYWAP
jgi:hypothetical protein